MKKVKPCRYKTLLGISISTIALSTTVYAAPTITQSVPSTAVHTEAVQPEFATVEDALQAAQNANAQASNSTNAQNMHDDTNMNMNDHTNMMMDDDMNMDMNDDMNMGHNSGGSGGSGSHGGSNGSGGSGGHGGGQW